MVDVDRLDRRLAAGGAVEEGLEAGQGDDDDGEGHLDDAEGVWEAMCVSRRGDKILRGSGEKRLTDEVGLAGADLEGDEADDGGEDGQGTEDKGQGDALGGREGALDEQGEGQSVDCALVSARWPSNNKGSGMRRTDEVAGQVEGKVEDEGLRGVEDAAGTLLLRPLDGDVGAAEEGVVEEDGEVAGADEGGDAPEGLTDARAGVDGEVGPVEGDHAELGEAHADVVEVVGGEADLGGVVWSGRLSLV